MAAALAITILRGIEVETGLPLQLEKSLCHCANKAIADEARAVMPEGIQVRESLDLVSLQSPIGSFEFVDSMLEPKLVEIEKLVDQAASMPYKHETYAILKSCASECRVAHIMRTIPHPEVRPRAKARL